MGCSTLLNNQRSERIRRPGEAERYESKMQQNRRLIKGERIASKYSALMTWNGHHIAPLELGLGTF